MAGRPKGGPKTGGRQKGTPNKITASTKESIEQAFQALGGQESFDKWCAGHKDDFYRLIWPKLLPKDVNANVKGDIQIVIAPHEAEY